ncbi:acyl-CoA dehydrogenase family protein [Streptomyces mirabilis]|uniref:acyl-CoA dehydrogenase family protein n=1 Tax=Streptomyces TaxID=1883 RepID=UPI001162318A|nr:MULTISPECIES: acyl-CoA dehydrogenase family protein [Streptomyces]MCX4612421.1 acyl-CoA dehydrogenase family protein [Streptomyces mirabilis]MCX5352645.1 acyl-CoA dehydrogenase family protein [Streptomyces mirabilis]QDN90746.1 acyl-CoA dehydrogenase [Streptomyces sp. RLB3-6]QDO11576.1 acyl-CoA dehydrogenase [Streptomyces sp. S1D4-23]
MTAFSLDPVQTAWCAELRALAEERLRPLAEKGEPGHVNRALVAELGRLGLLARLFTSGALDLCLMRESLARGCTEAETALALQGLGAHPVHAYGTRAQRERWLPRVADGSAVAAFALSEPGAGSDAAALALRADRDDARAPTSAPGPGEAAPAARGASSAASGAAPGVPGAVPAASGVVPAVPGTLPADPGSSPAASGVAPGVPGVAPAASGTVPAGPGPSGVEAQESPVAERDGWGSWRLSGEKCWISNAPEADFYTVFARTTPGAGARGVTAFLVPADRPGLTGTPLDMLSPHPIGALAFDAVPVTADDVLGEPDRGFRVAMHTLNLFRPSVGAFAVGMAEAALAATLTHTAGREAFGGRLKDLQTVAHQVAEMAMRTEAARLMVYAAAAAYDEGAPDVPRRAAMAKLLATETAQYVVDAAVQLHGARALRRGHLLEHLYREVRAPRIYEGASEVQRAVIAKELYASVEAP